MSISNSTFTGNQAIAAAGGDAGVGGNGGGGAVAGANGAGQGGGVYLAGPGSTRKRTTIAGNRASTSGDDVFGTLS